VEEAAIGKIIINATSTEQATGTINYVYSVDIPFFNVIFVITLTALCLGVFYLFFKAIWSD